MINIHRPLSTAITTTFLTPVMMVSGGHLEWYRQASSLLMTFEIYSILEEEKEWWSWPMTSYDDYVCLPLPPNVIPWPSVLMTLLYYWWHYGACVSLTELWEQLLVCSLTNGEETGGSNLLPALYLLCVSNIDELLENTSQKEAWGVMCDCLMMMMTIVCDIILGGKQSDIWCPNPSA